MFSMIIFSGSGKLAANRAFSPEAFNVFFQSLGVMWKGMAGIFAVIAVFYLIIKLLGRISDKE